jgi:ATP/maltotriose-dependent transcriptional regulator MalT
LRGDARLAKVLEHLVGRAAELGSLDRALAGLETGEPSALALFGEPGIGKTRLLWELAARGDERGWVVLSGSASELELDLPFWVFVDALDEYVAGLDPRRLASVEDDVRAELGRILPSLSDVAGAGEAALQDERYRAHRAVRELLERLAATKPLVLLLDDLHWADAASIELLGALLRRPPAAAVLMAMAARPRQLPDRMASALERANRAGSLTRLELGGLERDEAARLLGEHVDQALADRLYDDSGGNPFYLEQLARSPRPAPGARTGAADVSFSGVEVPPAVAAALAEELGMLSRPTRALLEGAAVAGDPFEPELAVAAAGVDEGSAVSGLDELLTVDLIRPTDVPRRFRFRHPIVRRAVYDSAPGGSVLAAHERCADALAARGASAAARAHHVEHAARQGDAAALAVLREAGEASTLRAPASAARWFGAALRVLPDTAPRGQRIELLMARARALSATGNLTHSHADLLESIELVPSDSLALWVRLTVTCAGVEHGLGRHEEAHARLAAALERLPDPGAPEAVALMIELAIDRIFRTEYDSMRDWAARALDAARPLGDGPMIAAAAAALMLAHAFTGAIAEAETIGAEVAARVEAMSDEELARRVDAAANLAVAELYLDHYREAGVHAARGLAVGRATGLLHLTVLTTLGMARFMQGDLAEAANVLDGAVEASRVSGIAQRVAWHLVNRSLAALAAGDVDTALATAEEAEELTRQLDERFISAWAGLALASARLPAGEPGRAVEVLGSSAGGQDLANIPGGWRTMGLELLTRCYLELGRREDASRAAALAEAASGDMGLPMAEAWAERAAAAVALDAGDPAAAAKRALASAIAADKAGAVVEAALSRTLAGRALGQAGDADAAAAELKRAATALEACGALRYRDAAEQELRKQGHRIHRPTKLGERDGTAVESLTERELQVARLVVDRRTNAEIAGELFLSLKTVESHMRNLFRKLDVSSRVEVARTVERAERKPAS